MKPRTEPKYNPEQRSKYLEKKGRPPGDQLWAWYTIEMMELPAFRELSGPARKVMDRVALEWLYHDRDDNGRLPVTFNDFQRAGISRKQIKPAIEEACRLGWIYITRQGVGGQIGDNRRTTLFAVGWLPTDEGDARNGWKRFKTIAEARAAVDGIRKRRSPPISTQKAVEKPAPQRLKSVVG